MHEIMALAIAHVLVTGAFDMGFMGSLCLVGFGIMVFLWNVDAKMLQSVRLWIWDFQIWRNI